MGRTLTLNLPAPAAGEYEVIAHLTKAKDYGNVQVMLDTTPIGSVINLYDPEVRPTGPISLGRVRLRAGPNVIRINIAGKDPRSMGYLVGVDAFVLKPL